MIFNEFVSIMKRESEDENYKKGYINLDKVAEINKLSKMIDADKMHYEHPVHSAWKSLGNFPLNGYQ